MTHKEVYKYYQKYLPDYANKTDEYFQNGQNSIRVRMRSKQEFIFTFTDANEWGFETVKQHVETMLKGDSHNGE